MWRICVIVCARPMTDNQTAREAILECQANAALGGHDLGPFEPVDNEAGRGWSARCRRYDLAVWVSADGPILPL